MERTLQTLLIANDPALGRELEGAVRELPEELRMALHVETDSRRGIEHAVNRSPDIVFLELGDDLLEAQRTATEISTGIGDTLLVTVYRPQMLNGDDRSSSTLIEFMRAGVRDFLRRPLSSSELEELLRRHFLSAGRAKSTRGKVVAFLGNKGGVGKSTLSLSVACGLAREAPGRVLLIDASLQHGAMCELLGVKPEATISDAALQIARLDERLLRTFSVSHDCGLKVLAAPANAIEAAPVDDQTFARVLAVARRAFDYVVVDTFPLIDSVTVAILDVADIAFVVLNDFVPAVLGTAELLKVLEQLGVSPERLRVVLNSTSKGFQGRLKAVDIARRLDRDLDFVVPFDRRVLAATNTGEPFALRASRRWGFGKAVRAIEREVLQWNPVGLAAPAAAMPEPGADPAEPTGDGRPLQEVEGW